MAIDFNGSTQYLSVNTTLLTDEPIDMVIHFNSDSITVTQAAMALADAGGINGEYSLLPAGSVASDPVRAIKRNDSGAGSSIFDTTTGYSASVWNHAGVTYISDTSRAVYLNGGSKTSNATSVTNPTNDNLGIGARLHSSIDLFFDGKLAEAYVLNANMSDTQHSSRAKGYSALWDVPIKNVRGWYPLLRVTDLQNRMNGYPALTATASPTTASHPPKVIYPRLGGLMCI